VTSWLRTLRHEIAQATANESDGLIDYALPPAVYASAETGIYGLVLPESPDRAIALSMNVVDEQIETTVAVQFRMRAENDDELDFIEDALSQSWTSRQAGTLGSIVLIMSRWASGASLGQDSSNRITRSVNYVLTVERSLRHRN
jgi:hypothetical protein